MIINYKNIKLLKIHLDQFNKIKKKKKNMKTKIQKKISKNIKIARFLSLLPYK
ncbi:30S ribosomal protein S18 [Candidatus Vidania fulgoroideorum]